MTIPTDIDHDAPVIAHHEIDIAATLNAVWTLHTDVDTWPSWNLEITAAALDGEFVPGNSFTWTSYGFTVTSTIYRVAERAETLWGGASQGIMGIHRWRFEPTPESTHVVTTESFSGDPVEAARDQMQSILDTSLAGWLNRLKTKAEATGGK